MKPELPLIQKWMQQVITHPDGIEAGIESDAAREQIDVGVNQVEQVIQRSQALNSLERLRVYGNAYYARLIDCLGEEYPALKHALGEETFASFAFAYLQQYPSTSYTLDQLGRHFVDYLQQTRPKEEPPGSWPDFLIDLARLEQTYNEVFDGPGIEQTEPLKTEELMLIPPEDWSRLRLNPSPCLRLLRFDFAVHEYATSVRKQEPTTYPQPKETFLVIFRWDYLVRRRPIDATQFKLLQLLSTGHPLGEALQDSLIDSPTTDATLATQLQTWFQFWTKWRFFEGVELV